MHNLQINAQRLWDSIMETAQIGGTAKGGVCRLTLTDLDRQVRDWFVAQCEEVGCTVTVDEMGNIFARRPGKDNSLPPIAMGSHLDTQPTGMWHHPLVLLTALLSSTRAAERACELSEHCATGWLGAARRGLDQPGGLDLERRCVECLHVLGHAATSLDESLDRGHPDRVGGREHSIEALGRSSARRMRHHAGMKNLGNSVHQGSFSQHPNPSPRARGEGKPRPRET